MIMVQVRYYDFVEISKLFTCNIRFELSFFRFLFFTLELHFRTKLLNIY